MKKYVLVFVFTISMTVTASAQLSWDFVTEYGYPTQSEPWQYGYGTQNIPSEFIQFGYSGFDGINPYWGIDDRALTAEAIYALAN